jgi:hypothetical protein
MDQRTALHLLAARADRAPRRPLPALTDTQLNEGIERYLAGDREIVDLVEMHVDDEAVHELSTAASVGTGPDRSVGRYHPDEDKQLEKILAQLEGYKRRMGLSEMRPGQIRQCVEDLGLPERMGEMVLEYLRRRGDV